MAPRDLGGRPLGGRSLHGRSLDGTGQVRSPLGRAAAWTPLNLGAALLGWWDASDSATITLNSGNVSGWASKVGGLTATQGTAAKQPPYSATALNNLPGLTFTAATGHFLSISSIATFPLAANPSTLVCAAQYTAGGNYAPVIGYGNVAGGAGRERDIMSPSTGNKVGISINGYDPATTSDWAGIDRIVVAEFAAASSFNVYVDGNAATNFTGGTMNTNGTSGKIGTSSGSVSFWNGVIQEIFVIDGVLSTTNRQKLEGYIAWKWALTASLPGGHPYKSARP